MKINETYTTHVAEPARIFGAMLEIGIPDNFKTDLWHDAMMLQELWKKHIIEPNKSWKFYWTLRESGTHMGEDRYTFVSCPCKHFHISGAYEFKFSKGYEGQKDFVLTIKRLDVVGQEADEKTRKAYGV